jgi:8-oxo-dGTP diphosphatase
MSYSPRLVTLIYCVRNNQVLLARRRKAPLIGYWVAPGGKIEAKESPYEGALRELREETGLTASAAELRAIVSETSQRADWQWLIFIYRVLNPVGEVISDEREGELLWFDLTALYDIEMPEADRHFVPHVLSAQNAVREWRFHYDDDLNIVAIHEFGLSRL